MDSVVKAIALPNGLAGEEQRRLVIAVYLWPELRATLPEEEGRRVLVKDSIFAEWPAIGGALEFRIFLENGTTSVSRPLRPVVHAINLRLWLELFADSVLTVRPMMNSVASSSQRISVRSYSVSSVAEALATVYRNCIGASGGLTTSSSASQGIPPVFLQAVSGGPSVSVLTGSGFFGSLGSTRPNLADETPIEREMRLLAEFHSDNGRSRSAHTPSPESDFHDLLSHLGEYPERLRDCGLLFDVEVPIGQGVSPASSGQVWVEPQLPTTLARVTARTRYVYADNLRRFAAASSDQTPELIDGMLPLERSESFPVETLDVDAAGLKALEFLRDLRRIAASPALDARKDAVPPSLRVAGISVIKSGRGDHLLRDRQRVARLSGEAQGGDLVFSAEDLVKGYRVRIWTEQSGPWRSLCRRRVQFNMSGVTVAPLRDEGWVSLGFTEHVQGQDRELYAHESLFTWNGWSVVAPRPGKSVPGNSATSGTGGKLKVTTTPEPKSLPPLRFGRTYKIQVRAADLAGNDMAHGNIDSDAHNSPPFVWRRFEPVPSPVLFARGSFTKSPGESPEVLVIRTGASVGALQSTERHIAPPRIAQAVAEMHGMFDGPDGLSKTAYDVIVNQDGQFEAEEYPVAQLVIPYLPDPLARGAAFRDMPHSPQTILIPFDGKWPRFRPFRLRLVPGSKPAQWQPVNRVLSVYLEPAEIATVRLSAHLDAESSDIVLNQLAMWNLGQSARPPMVADLATAGAYWALTPGRSIILVHAVQQPLRAPEFPENEAGIPSLESVVKEIYQTNAHLAGRILFDARSTGRLSLHGTWTEVLDDPLEPTPRRAEREAQVFERDIDYPKQRPSDPDIIVFGWDEDVAQEFGDTKFRHVTYKAIATSRFSEHFNFTRAAVQQQKDKFTTETPEGRRPNVTVVNSARPKPPDVLAIVPIFGWSESSTSRGPLPRSTSMARIRKGGGLRIYLARPWYSSGDDEKLAVVIWPRTAAHFQMTTLTKIRDVLGSAVGATEVPSELKPYVTQWGMDPLWDSWPLDRPIAVSDFLNRNPFTVSQAAGGGRYTLEELLSDPGEPYNLLHLMDVATFDPEYDADRRLWYCDIELNTGETYYPFVRLALARFQPHSKVVTTGLFQKLVTDTHLSRIVLAEFVQLTPTRSATVTTLPTPPRLRIAVSGVSYRKAAATALGIVSEIEATLEERDSDLVGHWLPVPGKVTMLEPFTQPYEDPKTTWTGEIALSGTLERGKYRLSIREFESLPDESGTKVIKRLVYADTLQV